MFRYVLPHGSKRFVWGLVALVLAALVVASSASATKAKRPGYAPSQAQSLANAPGGVDALSVVPVTLEEAQAAAAAPGAVTVGTIPTVAPADYSPTALVAPSGQSSFFAIGDYGCAAVRGGWHWGLPPYRVLLSNVVTWCARLGWDITSVTGNPDQWAEWLCGPEGTNWYLSGGGPGAGWAQVHASGNWGCPTTWLGFQVHHWGEINVNSWGNSAYGNYG